MPFKSEKQRRWMHANEPEMAKRWEKEEKMARKPRKPKFLDDEDSDVGEPEVMKLKISLEPATKAEKKKALREMERLKQKKPARRGHCDLSPAFRKRGG